uniref:spore germination protein n=1 Tax=Gottfriedia luciferensis TaxID=178774 RepID=UPI00115505A9
AGSRAGVPYPSIYEVLFMMVALEMLVEASIRLPRVIGPTATTVGGLILGQAAQQAQLVSSIMIIITAFVAISNFTVPISAMSFAIRCIRYPLIILATLFGMVGLIGGVITLICYLANKRTFGTPFLAIEWGSTNKIETITQNPKEGHS